MTEPPGRGATLPRTAASSALPARPVMIAVVLTAFGSALNLSPVNVAVPAMMADFGVDAGAGSWIPLSYLLAVAVAVVPAGQVAGRVGRAQVLVAALGVTSLGCLAGAVAPGFAALVAARVVQGVGAGMCFAVSTAMIAEAVPPSKRGEKIGVALTATYLGLTVGPLVGGLLSDLVGWRAVLVAPVPLLVAALVVTSTRLAPASRPYAPDEPFDLAGAALYGAGMVLGIWGASSLPALSAVLAALAGAVVFGAFVRHVTRVEVPVFDVRLFVTRPLFGRSCLAAVLMYAGLFSTTFVMSLYFQNARGMGAFEAGAILVAQPVFMATLARPVGRWSDTREPRVLASAGLGLSTLGLLVMSVSHAAAPLALPVAGLALSGLGMALFSSPNHNAIMGAVERRDLSAASAALAVMRIVGMMASMVVVALVFSLLDAGTSDGARLIAGIHWSLRAAALLSAVGVWVSWTRGDLHRGGEA